MALVRVSMDQHTPERFANFEATLAALPEVLECLLITGQDSDYQLKVAVRGMDHYQAPLLDKIACIQGVTGCIPVLSCAASSTAPVCRFTPARNGALSPCA